MGLMDKLRDKMQAGRGQAKQGVGKATDNQQWQVEGKADQAAHRVFLANHVARHLVENSNRQQSEADYQ